MNIQTDFGYNQIRVGNLTIYTGKIRILGQFKSYVPAIKAEYIKGYTTLSFETINPDSNELYKKKISGLVYTLKKARLEQQYGWIKI